MSADPRPSALAGSWYPADHDVLRQSVASYLRAAAPEVNLTDTPIGLLAPHAGHHYSGPVAGYAFAAVLEQKFDTVVVISPFHAGHSAALLTSAHESYATPLGEIPVDHEILADLEARLNDLGGPRLTAIRNETEHAIEIELPFLQVALSAVPKLVPLMHASLPLAETAVLAEALAGSLRDKNALLIASSDLCHFYPEAAANRLDQAILNAVATFQAEEVFKVHAEGRGQACGLAAILTVMQTAGQLGAARAEILQYATSGAVSGNYQRVVGYGAGVFLR